MAKKMYKILIIPTKNECKKQFTLANGCLNLNEWFDLERTYSHCR